MPPPSLPLTFLFKEEVSQTLIMSRLNCLFSSFVFQRLGHESAFGPPWKTFADPALDGKSPYGDRTDRTPGRNQP
jgi:hypothetical protein